MLASEFGCVQEPFKLTPDPKFLYTSPDQLESYSRLFSGIHARKGLFVLTGESGTGKTLLLRRMMDDLAVSGCTVFFFCNPVSSFDELLAACCEQVGLEGRLAGSVPRGSAFTEFIAKSGEIAVLLLDEAHALPDKVLKNLVQFSTLAKNGGRLLQIVLSGQPALEPKLESLGLKSAVAGRAELRPLSDREVGPFVYHQLRTAGCNAGQLFSAEAITRVARYSKGLPGRINTLCGSALLIASLESQSSVSAEMIDQAAEEREIDRPATGPGGAKALAYDTGGPRDDPFREVESFLSSPQTGASTRPFGVGDETRLRTVADPTVLSARTQPEPDGGEGIFAGTAATVGSRRVSGPDTAVAFDLADDELRNEGPAVGPLGAPELTDLVRKSLEDSREFAALSTEALRDAVATTSSPDTATRPRLVVTDPAALAPPTEAFPADEGRDGRGFGIGTALLALLVVGMALYVINPPYEPVTKARNAVDDLVRMAVEAVSPGSAADKTPPASDRVPPSASPPLATDDAAPPTDPAQVANRATESPPAQSSSAGDGASPPEPGAQLRPYEEPDIALEPMTDTSPRPKASPEAVATADPARRATTPESSPPSAVSLAPAPDPTVNVATAPVAPLEAEEPKTSLDTAGAPESPAVAPAATTPTLTVRDVSGNEDTPIPLDIALQAPGDIDALELTVRGMPRGATLSAGERMAGVWRLSPSDLQGLTVNPPPNSDQHFGLSLQLVDSATGNILENRTLKVTLNAVADPPGLRAFGANGDQFTAMPLQIRSWLSDKDGSESLNIKLGGLPPSATLSAGRREADGAWSLSPAELQGLVLTPRDNTPPQIALKITAVAVESSNNAMSTASETITLGVVSASLAPPEPEVSYGRDVRPVVVPSTTRREPAPQTNGSKGGLRPDVLSSAELVARGEQLIELGNFDGARHYLEGAAQSGDARAATALGKTYDPVLRTTPGQFGSLPDAAAALDWYARAANAGDSEARMRENALRNWLAR